MVRFALGDAAKDFANFLGIEACDVCEVDGDDVICWRKTSEKRQVPHRVEKVEEPMDFQRRYQAPSQYDWELVDEQRNLEAQLSRFNPFKNRRLRKQIAELEEEVKSHRAQSSQIYDQGPERWTVIEYTTESFPVYKSTHVWHVNCDSIVVKEEVVPETREVEEMIFDLVNTSIITALMTPRLDLRCKAVENFVKDCERNHKGRFKAFLDTSREGRQLKLIDVTFEELLLI
jgi:hypothetical protein